jgi:hypothetical protein
MLDTSMSMWELKLLQLPLKNLHFRRVSSSKLRKAFGTVTKLSTSEF